MSNSPTGEIGFDTPTHLANIPKDNCGQSTGELFFTQLMKSVYRAN